MRSVLTRLTSLGIQRQRRRSEQNLMNEMIPLGDVPRIVEERSNRHIRPRPIYDDDERTRAMRNQAHRAQMNLNPSERNEAIDRTYEDNLQLAEEIGDVSRGLRFEQIERLPIATCTEIHSGQCTICLRNFIPNQDRYRTLPCFHIFHDICIDQYLTIENHCPICRNVIEIN